MAATAPSEKVALELGFELLGQQFIEEYQANALLYRHKKTGAEIMSVIADDENKVFGAVLRTPVYVPPFFFPALNCSFSLRCTLLIKTNISSFFFFV